MVATHTHEVSTTGQGDAHDLTAAVSKAVGGSGLTAGVATVFVVGSTAGVTTLEYESGVVHDLDRALQEVAPREADYRHHLRWGDDNGSSHVRAALVGALGRLPAESGKRSPRSGRAKDSRRPRSRPGTTSKR